MKKIFEIEDYYGNSLGAFMIEIIDNELVVTKTIDCSVADIQSDYIFDTNNDLYRIQCD